MVEKFTLNLLEKKGIEQRLIDSKQQLDEIYKNGETVVLFGAGTIGIQNLNVIKEISKVNIVFCDNNKSKQGISIEGICVISFRELLNNYKNSRIIITSVLYYDEILMQLEDNKLDKNVINPFDVLLIYFEYRDYYKLIEENEAEFRNVYELLSDEYSKKIFIERLNYCITGNPNYLISLKSNEEQYFEDDIINLTKDEVFIDGGGYTGDTVISFLKKTNSEFKRIYSFEPEKSKHEEFKKNFSSFENIELIPYGLWEKEDILSFDSQNDSSSCISESGDTHIQVTSIDEILHGDEATFIKMDIEGAELAALRGAKNTIRNYKPKLAICVYHKPLDIIEIPKLIKAMEPSYKLYLRHYSKFHSDTILYAISK